MSELVNGQVVPALGQWQGAILIAATLAMAYVFRRCR